MANGAKMLRKVEEELERSKWNQRYVDGTHGTLIPDPLLIEAFEQYIEPLYPTPGCALDVAGGPGRHAIFLAEKGWKVTLIDIAEAGLANARRNAETLDQHIEFLCADLTQLLTAGLSYDLILVFYFVRRPIFKKLINALNPGGLLVYKGYLRTRSQSGGGPSNPDFYFEENELLHSFSELRVLHYRELTRNCGTAEFVGRKPGCPRSLDGG
jgi:tellurite methyltransferase